MASEPTKARASPNATQRADVMHCHGSPIANLANFHAAITQHLKHPAPPPRPPRVALIEKSEHVYPMVPAGETTDDMVLGSK